VVIPLGTLSGATIRDFISNGVLKHFSVRETFRWSLKHMGQDCLTRIPISFITEPKDRKTHVSGLARSFC
jgi:hypothetical protein